MAGVSAMERVRLSGALASKVAELLAMPRTGAALEAMRRARLASEVSALVVKLGGDPVASKHTRVLADIAAGRHDSTPIDELLALLSGAVRDVQQDDGMTAEAEAVAHAAITHWVKLEEVTHG